MYKNIIPGLVSFDTDMKEIAGFLMCPDFDFFKGTERALKFHYKVVLSNDILVPRSYDVRSEYGLKSGRNWFYERKVFFWNPIFHFDLENKTFYFNRAYYAMPFRLGGTCTVGETISNLIELDLFLNSHVALRGIAFEIDGKAIGISAPGFNGKTTVLKDFLLRKKARYIAEDYLILDTAERKTYTTCPLTRENFWRRRKVDGKLQEILGSSRIVDEPVRLDNLYLVENALNRDYHASAKTFADFLMLNSLCFLDDPFVRSYIYEQGLTDAVFDRINELRRLDMGSEFVSIKHFCYDFLKYAIERK